MGKLLALAVSRGEILEVDTDTGTTAVFASGLNRMPDGIVEDPKTGRVYWTDMGADPAAGTGSIERVDADGGGRTTIVPVGGAHTPKQLAGDWVEGKLYWSDREGMRVMSCDLDGENVETLIDRSTGEEDEELRRCVGVAVDHGRGQLYWTQKGPEDGGLGRIFRTTAAPAPDPAHRPDLEMLWSGLPEPIDLELDLDNELVYWTDRGAPPTGNTLNRAPLPAHRAPGRPPEILADGFGEAIGLALTADRKLAYVSDLAGAIHEVDVTARTKRPVLWSGTPLTGLVIRKHGG
ncbi:SMP-30/gluconolactonase/LRE family protein [Nocardia aurantia]|uniref:3-hydroxyacyl-CoA dehydrogenase n=1 Tax=Nocardia aurantia TaxID=2585199 RepID=A0A7K0DMJ5_9NOCA|nr:3-hydroxyacyl-CoA dehydrogenase [Nocardia aurantia]MQY26919.1 hypothetical protein [Nocardia aurantia]